MKIEHVFTVAGLLIAASSTAACTHASEKAGSSESAITDPGDPDDIGKIEVEDLDGDDIAEVWATRRDLCGTGGCTYTIRLSTRPDEVLGQAFGKQFYMRGPRGSALQYGDPAGFTAENRGGQCYYSLDHYEFDGAAYHITHSIDCNEVINRAEGAPIAQFEERCFSLIPVDQCRTPAPEPTPEPPLDPSQE
jgi:hypothetical protein